MKKILIVSILFITIITLTGCNKTDAETFKEEYESLNGTTNDNGKEHRYVSISEDNPFVYKDASEIIDMINSGETFYVYFGSKTCPWCRSVIEKAIEVADNYGIDTIYYVDIWDDDGNEILRDTYAVDASGEAGIVIDGTSNYYELLELLDNVLPEYTLTNDEETVSVGEKRIYAPNFIYIEDGKAVKLTTGISEKQEDSREELTDDILTDEEEAFNEFFDN